MFIGLQSQSHRIPIRYYAVATMVAVLCFAPQLTSAQTWSPTQERAQETSRRYYQALLQRPEPGALFERWTRSLSEPQRLEIVESLGDKQRSEAESLVLAMLHLQQRDYATARSVVEEVEHPNERRFRIEASIALASGHMRDGAHALKRWVASADKKRVKASRSRTAADLLLRVSQDEHALPFLEQLFNIAPSAEARTEYVDVLVSTSRYNRALEVLQRGLKNARNGRRRGEILARQGDILLHTNRVRDAIKKFSAARRLVRRGWFATQMDGRLLKAHRSAGSLPSFYPVLRKRWRKTSMVADLATVAEEVGESDDALRFYRRAWNHHPTERTTEAIVRILQARGDISGARVVYDRWMNAARVVGPDVRARYAKWLFFQARDVEAAKAALDEIRAAGPSPRADVVVATQLVEWGMHQDALTLFERNEEAYRNDPIHAEAYGRLRAKLGQRVEALALFDRLLTHDAELERFAEVTAEHGFDDRAIDAYRKVIEKRPTHVPALKALASLHEKRIEYKKAGEYLRRAFAIARHPRLIPSIIAFARLDPQAEKAFAARFENDPAWGLVLAEHHFASIDRDVQKGFQVLEQTVERTLQHDHRDDRRIAADAIQRLAVRYGKTGRHERSVYWWEQLADAFSDLRGVAYEQIFEQIQHLTPDDQSRIVARAVSEVPYADFVWAYQARRALSDQNYEEAIRFFAKAAERDEHNSEYKFELAALLAQRGESTRARELYIKIIDSIPEGTEAIDAALSALDLCETERDFASLELKLRALERRLPHEAFLHVMLNVYDVIYNSDLQKLRRRVRKHAERILGLALESQYPDEQIHALTLLLEFDSESSWKRVNSVAQKSPRDRAYLALLAKNANVKAIPLFEKAAISDEPATRRWGVYGLVRTRARDIDARVARMLEQSRSSDDRVLAAWALGESNSPTAERELLRLWEIEKDPWVKRVMIWSLVRMQNWTFARAALEDHDRAMAAVAASTLAASETPEARKVLLDAYWSAHTEARKTSYAGLTKRFSQTAHDIWNNHSVLNVTDISDLIADRIHNIVASKPELPITVNYERFEQTVVAVAEDKLGQPSTQKLVLADLVEIASEELARPTPTLAGAVEKVMRALQPSLRKIAANDSEIGMAACAALPYAKDEHDIVFLLSKLQRIEKRNIQRILDALQLFPSNQVVTSFRQLLDSPFDTERAIAMVALSHVTKLSPGLRAEFARRIEGFVDDGGPIEVLAIETLGALKDPDSPTILAKSFKGAPGRKRRAILRSLNQIRTPESWRLYVRLNNANVKPPCSDGGKSLPELLKSRCDAIYESDLPAAKTK